MLSRLRDTRVESVYGSRNLNYSEMTGSETQSSFLLFFPSKNECNFHNRQAFFIFVILKVKGSKSTRALTLEKLKLMGPPSLVTGTASGSQEGTVFREVVHALQDSKAIGRKAVRILRCFEGSVLRASGF